MAITISVQPDTMQSAGNPCVFEFTSTNTGQTNFSFLVEVTVNGAVDSYHQVFPESSTYGKFDCSEIISNKVFSKMIVDGTLATNYSDALCSYSIRVQEKYGTNPVPVGGWTSSATKYAFNGALRHQDYIAFDYQDYDLASTQGSLMLTAFPRDQRYYCGLNESMFVGFLMSTAAASSLEVYLKDESGSTLYSSLSNVMPTSERLVVADVSPSQIVSNTSITDANFDEAFYYEVEFTQGLGDTENFKIYIDRECSLYTSRRLHWLNKFGVWDSFSFRLYSEDQTEIKDAQFQREKGVWSDSNTWDYNLYNGQNLSAGKSSEDFLIINSDWIHQDVQNWLVKSLCESPSVYLEVSEGNFEPVVVERKSFRQKRRVREGLINETFRVKRTYTYRSQLS